MISLPKNVVKIPSEELTQGSFDCSTVSACHISVFLDLLLHGLQFRDSFFHIFFTIKLTVIFDTVKLLSCFRIALSNMCHSRRKIERDKLPDQREAFIHYHCFSKLKFVHLRISFQNSCVGFNKCAMHY